MLLIAKDLVQDDILAKDNGISWREALAYLEPVTKPSSLPSTTKVGPHRFDESELASAMEQGFRAAGWKGALTKGIETRQAQRKTGYSSACRIAELDADMGDKDQAFRWLNTAYQE